MLEDPALETLFMPFAAGLLDWPARRTLFLRARSGPALTRLPPTDLVCVQTFRPDAAGLEAAAFAIEAATPDELFPLVLALPPRQRDEARALLAQAVAQAAPGGTVVVAQLNEEGARGVEDDLARLAGPVESLSKRKCRVFWARPAAVDAGLLAEWAAFDRPQPIAEGRFLSRPGLFAWDRIDAGSALLAAHLPQDLAGRGADLGAGFGYLAAEILARCPGVTALDLYEAESRALDLARRNLEAPSRAAPGVALDFLWHDVTAGLPRRYDFIVTNPPFHQGRAERVDVGRGFVTAAAAALVPGGRLWLVANAHLPYEAELKARFSGFRFVAETGGYKIVEAVKG